MAIRSPAAGDELEPGVRLFVEQVMADFARRAGGRALQLAEARRIAEEVRRPWRAGGPAMAQITELTTPPAPSVRVRVYTPRGAAQPNGGLVYLHGGGWTLFSLDTHDRLMREYADRAGLTVIGVDYALAPEAKFPVALGEVVRVLDWLATAGEGLGVDPTRLAVGGDSAGANLALAAALARRDAGARPRLRALLLNYGCFQVGSSAEAIQRFGDARAMLTADEMAGFWRNYLRTPADALEPLACPMRADLAGLPPTMLVIAERDVLAEQSLMMADRMKGAGVQTRSVVYPGASHSFLEAVSVSPLSQRALQEASEWLRERCA